MAPLVDAHIHLDVIDGFAPGSDLGDDDARAFVPGVTPTATRAAIARLGSDRRLRFGAAWHPWYLPPRDHGLDALDALLDHVHAVGETGLDRLRHRTQAERELAEWWFVAHIERARARDLPLVIHCVRAHGRCLELLRTYSGELRGVVHGFTGSAEVAADYAREGFAVSFGPALLRSKRARATAIVHDPSWVLIETDAPFMSTAETRGSPGRPGELREVLRALATLRDVPEDALRAQTYANAKRLGLCADGATP